MRETSPPEYVELQCHTNFTFLQGASSAEELVERAQRLRYAGLAITDECSLAGVVCALVAAEKCNFPLLIGARFHLVPDEALGSIDLTLIAQNRRGYGNLCELITLARMRSPKGAYHLAPSDILAPPAGYDHLRGVPDCLAILSPAYPALALDLTAQTDWVKVAFPNRAWIGLNLLGRPYDASQQQVVYEVAEARHVPIVAVGNVLMHVRSRKPLQDTLSAVRLGTPVAECGYALEPNAERHLRHRLRLATLYPPEALAETIRIAQACSFSLRELEYQYPNEIVPPGMGMSEYLRQETYVGAARRYPDGVPLKVQAQIEHELILIGKLKYEPYFLSVYDLVRFARNENILCQGRGSAANSAVCYCLGITEVDPARGNTLFERFISEERNEPPDIDIDFEHQRREEVIQYIYRKYGRSRAAIAAAVATYRPRSALRDVGKALGVDLDLVERVVKTHQWFDSSADLLKRFEESGLDPAAPVNQMWARLASALLGFPRHLSQHSGGFVISQEKLSRLVPIENAAMPERSVIQWDKDDLDALKLLKVDVLALGMLSAIRRALALVGERRGEPFELQDVPAEDPATYKMISRADTLGVFQIESRAQMSMLPRMKPECFYDLVIEVAIVRPGPIQGGMVHPYLCRRQGLEPVVYPSDEVRTALERTLGVPIFQEQVMQIAMLAAGFTAGEADGLRRAMAAWKRRGGLGGYYERIVNGMLARGYDKAFAESIFAQIQGFGEYGFPESHAASFALLVYASSWLKCHEPEAFLCAMLNSQPMGFYSPSQLVQDAKRHGVVVHPVDITRSSWDSTLENAGGDRPAVRLGLSLVSGMGSDAAWQIEAARAVKPFTDVVDLGRRAKLGKRELEALAAANALLPLTGHRRQALWQVSDAVPERGLLHDAGRLGAPEDQPHLPEASETESVFADYRAIGLTLGRHPVALLRDALLERRLMPAATLLTYSNGRLARGCGLVTVRQRPGTANGVMFVTLEDESGTVNVIVWESVQERFRKEALGATLLAVYGTWQCEGKVRHLVASRLEDRTHMLRDLQIASRNFC